MENPDAMLPDAFESRIKLRHYRLLAALDRHRSVTRVAEALGISQPSVTRSLSDIEHAFRTALFARTGRGLEPTPAGKIVIERARHAIAESESLWRELETVRGGWQGRLRLGVIPYASTRVLDAAWSHLFALRPRIAASAVEDVTGNLMAALRARAIDCAICRFGPTTEDAEVEQVLLYQQRPRIVVARRSAAWLGRLGEGDIVKLTGLEWILPPADTPIRGAIDAIFSAAGRQAPLPTLETYAIRTIASALRTLPRGIAILPEDIARAVCAGGGAEPLAQELAWSLPPVGLAWLRGSPKTAMVASLHRAILADQADAGGTGEGGARRCAERQESTLDATNPSAASSQGVGSRRSQASP